MRRRPHRRISSKRFGPANAEGALRAARDAVRVFGKTDAEMDHIIAERKVDSTLVVASLSTGGSRLAMLRPGSSCNREAPGSLHVAISRPCGCLQM